ncbi:MAG: histidine kinase [Muribaculaceae bacterium]|nr:histidine kinase [Muribaculaceae bacterium]
MGKKFTFNRATLIHVLCWGLLLAFPLFMYRQNDTMTDAIRHYLRSLGGTLCYMIIFYLNYIYLIPKLLFFNKRKRFVFYNIIAIFVLVAAMTWWWHLMGDLFPNSNPNPPFNAPPKWTRFVQMSFMLILVIGLSAAIRMSQRWQKMQEAKKEAERIRTDAELKNLRNQLNPHFLLNTLNNIYALIAFDPDKAQVAVGELSKLLRHALYDNQKHFVPLYKEVEFIENYIDLMKMRVTNNVKINTNIDIDEDDSTPIAPLIFISLIENAFKHGISQAGDGEIDITITNKDDRITCEITNTNHPKRDNDKSGSGIGLEQVAKRLELMYPNRYTWEKGLDSETNKYFSRIVLWEKESGKVNPTYNQ